MRDCLRLQLESHCSTESQADACLLQQEEWQHSRLVLSCAVPGSIASVTWGSARHVVGSPHRHAVRAHLALADLAAIG